MEKIRTRFAPSPTGFLHIGSLRTVLFDYLIAKSLDGKIILRIEDTDQKREVEGAVEKLLDILNWVGIKFDEGPHIGGDYGPYTQSERRSIYDKYIKILLERGGAYYCFCSSERLDEMRNKQQKKKLPPRYDRFCRELSRDEVEKKIKAGEKYVIRQKMPLSGEIKVYDELIGEIKFKTEDLEDQVLIKSDGMPTYQFANVVDDHLMEISHIVRGTEWIPSFPKNILLYKAFGWESPKFIHLPLTLNKEGGKLSKRNGDVTIENYRNEGYLPEAILNFSALMGWHPKGEKEIFSIEEIIKEFKIKDMGKSPSIFDVEKLNYLNGYYIRKKTINELYDLCEPFLKSHWSNKKTKNISKELKLFDKEYVKKIIALEQERLKKISEIGELTEFFFIEDLEYESDLLVWKKMEKNDVKNNLKIIYSLLEKIFGENWTNDSIEEALISHINIKGEKVGNFLWPMRVALTGKKASPGPFDVAEILEKKESLKRIDKAIDLL